MTGIELIAQERKEQIEKHGRIVERDVAENTECELVQGADALIYLLSNDSQGSAYRRFNMFPSKWSEALCIKMAEKPYKERLIIAGALIAAEIDRIQFNESDPRDNPLIGEDDSWVHDVDMGAK